MRHLLFILGLLTTASTGQDKPQGPILPPQNPPPVKMTDPAVPSAADPVAPVKSGQVQTVNTLLLKDLEFLKANIPQIFDIKQNDRFTAIKRGELKAILKIAAGIPAHLHGRDYNYKPLTESDGSYRLTITDKSLNIEIASGAFDKSGAFKELSVIPENLKKLAESEKNPYASWGLLPSLERLASLARLLVGHESYPTVTLEGEMEYLMMDAMIGDKPDLRNLETFSTHEPKTGRNYFYHVIVLQDKATRQTRGVIGFFHSNQKGYPLVDLITSVGPRAVSQDVIQTFMQRIKVNQNSQVRR